MSYSFTVRQATKADLIMAAAAQFATISQEQPVHKLDEVQALGAAKAFADLLPDTPPAGRIFALTINGWLSTEGKDQAPNAAAVSITVGFAVKEG